MKMQLESDPTNNISTYKKDEKAYINHLEVFLISLLCKKPMNFHDIVRCAEGAYPTDVLQTLNNLVLTNRIEQLGELYRAPARKYKSKIKGILRLGNAPLFPENLSALNLSNETSVFADPHPADYDWRFTSKARDELTKRLCHFIECNSEIGFFGAPTLFLNLYRSDLHVTLFDSSASIIADLKSSGVTHGLVHHNLFDPLPEFNKKYDVIVADPPWYVPFYKASILRSSELLKEHGLLMISLPPWLTRPSAIADRTEIIIFAGKAGFCLDEISPKALLYQCPKFEQVALSVQNIHCGNWRHGDLFIFRKISEAMPSLKVLYPKDEPTWDEYRFGNLKLKLRQRKQIDVGKLKIKPVSDQGPYLGTVSRRSPLRYRIDLWTSDNIAYSIKRIDIVKVALDRLQTGESIDSIVTDLSIKLSKTEANTLSKLLTKITIPYELYGLKQTSKPQSIINEIVSIDPKSYTKKFIAEEVCPNISNSFWQQRLSQFLHGSMPHNIHLAVFVEPYLKYILEGQKTVESRFNTKRCAPYQKVCVGDILLLKRSSGPVVGLCEVASVWFYRLDPKSWQIIKSEFAQALCAQDPSFWENRKHASYATLMRIQHVCPIDPAKFKKSDRRGWILLTNIKVKDQIGLEDE